MALLLVPMIDLSIYASSPTSGFFNSSVAIEDEYHVLFNCIAYHDIRSIFIASETHTSNLYNFVSLMKNNNPQVVISLAHFINKMFKTRKMLCDL